ncbi:hypothetical protein FXN61_01035 [Lentzea sp. PSKA42]|uniref:Uncharacterized protein n=1 Tax=Lentzea indica TaxID=2604800 RepID=A0ABX1F9D1_9PSEU|nr:hypothetical protein [Lentzea indica]NKE55479.1 hypothetical protein [Lentzea indica]
MAQSLGMGHLKMAGVMPCGHNGKLMPERMYYVDDSHATFEGADLGTAVRLKDNPMIGGVALPSRGVLAMGQATWEILDREEHERTLREVSGPTSPEVR